MQSRIPALFLLFLVTLASGAMQGKATFRWGVSPELERAAMRLPTCDFSSETWGLLEKQSFDDPVLQILQCEGYLKHVYFHRASQEVVVVAVFVGPTGPMVVHTPEVCYPANAFEMTSSPQRISLTADDGSRHQLMKATFQANNVHRSYLRVYYGWVEGESPVGRPQLWKAPSSPRVAFAHEPFLFRIQLATTISPAQLNDSEDAVVRFMRHSFRHRVLPDSLVQEPRE